MNILATLKRKISRLHYQKHKIETQNQDNTEPIIYELIDRQEVLKIIDEFIERYGIKNE